MFRISYICISCALAVSWSNWANAAATLASEIPQAEVCSLTGSGHYQLNTGRFLAWAFDQHDVPRACADRNKDGVETFEEKRLLVVNPYAAGPKCEVVDAVSDLAYAIVNDPGRAFRVSKPGGGPASEADLFSQPPRVVVTCLNVKAPATASTAKPFRLSKLSVGRWKVKLRGNQQSLRADADDKNKFKKAEAAQLSFSGDEIKNSEKITAKVALGLDSGYVPVGNAADFRLIPYVKFDSEFAETPVKKNSVDKLAFGVLGEFFYVGDLMSTVITFDPQYLTDSDQESEIVAGTVRLDPALTIRRDPLVTIPGGETPILPFLKFDYSIDGLLRFGRVIDPGNKPELLETANFLYYGPVFDLFFLGAGFLEPLKINLSYYYLWRAEGQFKRIENFSASAALTLDKDGHMEFKATYDNGRDFENFAERQKWVAALGYKF